jgi:hypothetical protein
MRLLVPAIVLSLVSGVQGAAAQEESRPPAEHQGFWIGFGLGGGTNFADWADGARAGVGGYVRLGGSVSQRFLIGGELIGWGRDRNGATFTESGATAIAVFYPADRGIFVKGGAGFAAWAASSSGAGTTSTQTAGGFAGTVGVGYDLRIGANVFLTPNLDFMYHTMESDNTAFASIDSGAVLLFTLGITWH